LVVKLLQQLRRGKLEFADGYEAALDSFFRKTEQRLFCPMENLLSRIGLVKALGHDLVRAVHHLPEQRFLTNDFDVVFDVDQVRNTFEEICQIRTPACAFELRSTHELFLDRDQIDGARSFNELDHLSENDAV